MVNEEQPVRKKAASKKKTPAPKPKRTAAARPTRSVRSEPRERKSPSIERQVMGVTAEQRRAMIAEAAYFKAERRGFVGDPGEYWREAEVEVDALLMD